MKHYGVTVRDSLVDRTVPETFLNRRCIGPLKPQVHMSGRAGSEPVPKRIFSHLQSEMYNIYINIIQLPTLSFHLTYD